MDIVGCPECPVSVKGDIRVLTNYFKPGQFGAVFVGHVLETIPGGHIPRTIQGLYEVADEVFVVHLPDRSLSSRFNPEVNSVIHRAPPELKYAVDYTDLETGKRHVARIQV